MHREDHDKKLISYKHGELVGQEKINVSDKYKQSVKEASSFVDKISEIPVHDLSVMGRADMIANGTEKDDDGHKKSNTRAFASTRFPSAFWGDYFWKSASPAVFLPDNEFHHHQNKNVMAHELGHVIEGNDPYVHRMVQMFLNYRVGNEQPVQLNKVLHSGYGDNEKGRKDKFDRAFDLNSAYYCGKDYGGRSSEILSMGIQQLEKDPVGFFKKDPEYANFVLGVLQYKSAHHKRKLEGA